MHPARAMSRVLEPADPQTRRCTEHVEAAAEHSSKLLTLSQEMVEPEGLVIEGSDVVHVKEYITWTTWREWRSCYLECFGGVDPRGILRGRSSSSVGALISTCGCSPLGRGFAAPVSSGETTMFPLSETHVKRPSTSL